MCPFPLGCPPCWHIIVHSILLWFFYISVVSVVIFSFLILFTWVLSLCLLLSLARGLLNLFISKKKKVVSFIDLFYCFWTLFYLSSLWSLLFPSFCWLWILFVLFLILLGGKLGCLRFFSCFLRKACISMNFPLRTAFPAFHRLCKCMLSFLDFPFSSIRLYARFCAHSVRSTCLMAGNCQSSSLVFVFVF